MKYRIDTLHKRGREVYMISKYLNTDGTLTINLFPGKTFRTPEEATKAAEDYKAALEDGTIF